MRPTIAIDAIPEPLQPDLAPVLAQLVQELHPEGLWLFGSWARGSARRRSDVDLLVMGLADRRLREAYDAVMNVLRESVAVAAPGGGPHSSCKAW